MAKSSRKKPVENEIVTLDLDIKCVLSGNVPKTEEVALDYGDGEDPYPIGWLRITVERVLPNPEWVRLFQTREQMIASSIDQALQGALAANKILTDDEKNAAMGMLRTNFEAQYKYSLDTTPKYVEVSEEVWVAPPENVKGLQKEWNDLADVLGVTLAATDVEDAADE
jgi:hypothetical protein